MCVQQLKGNTKKNVILQKWWRSVFISVIGISTFTCICSIEIHKKKKNCKVSKVYALISEQIEYKVLTRQNSMFKCILLQLVRKSERRTIFFSSISICKLDRSTLISCATDDRSISIDAISLKWLLTISFLMRPNFLQ